MTTDQFQDEVLQLLRRIADAAEMTSATIGDTQKDLSAIKADVRSIAAALGR